MLYLSLILPLEDQPSDFLHEPLICGPDPQRVFNICVNVDYLARDFSKALGDLGSTVASTFFF
jgi:hypothetical protein